jgi:hypothetical protein
MWKLRPGAVFQLEGTNFTQWSDPNGLNPPSWAEVMAQIEKDKAFADELEAKHKAELEGVAQSVAEAEAKNPNPPTIPEDQHPTPIPSEFAKPVPLAGSK